MKQFINIESARLWGFEIGYTSTFSRDYGFSLNIFRTKAWNAVTDEPLPEIPPLEARTTIYYNLFGGKVVPELIFGLRLLEASKTDNLTFDVTALSIPALTLKL